MQEKKPKRRQAVESDAATTEPVSRKRAKEDPLPNVHAGEYLFRCIGCGATTELTMPLPWDWLEEHSRCERAGQRPKGSSE